MVERLMDYNTVRPTSSLDFKPPAPETVYPLIFNPFLFTSGGKNTPGSNLTNGTKIGGSSVSYAAPLQVKQ